MTFEPRPYQSETEAAINAFWAAGKAFPLVIAPTGAGKTEISKMLLAPYRSPMSVVHTRTLFEQTARRIPNARVYTVQGLLAKGPAGDARRAGLERHDIAFFDEGHHLGGEEWQQVLKLPTLPARRFGVTATPMRADGTALGDIYDCFHVAAKYSELVAAGYLCKCDVIRSDITRSRQKREKKRPDGVQFYLDHGRREDGSPRPGIHFEVTIEQCEDAARRYNEAGIRAKVISNNTDFDERRRIFDAYTAGELDMLVSPTVLAEGFDSPRAEVEVLRRNCDNVGDYIQRVGRILRPFPGKERALLLDICNGTQKHGLPTDDRVYSLDGKGIRTQAEVDEEQETGAVDEPAPSPWKVVQSKYVMVRDTLLSRYRDIAATAEELGYKPGWVFHRFAQVTSLKLPARMPSKYASTCKTCRHRVTKGEEIFWLAESGAMHPECWVQSLDNGALELASHALEQADDWKPNKTRHAFDHCAENAVGRPYSRPLDSSSVHGDDDIPF